MFPNLHVLSIDFRDFTIGGIRSTDYAEYLTNLAPFIRPTLTRVNIMEEDGQGCNLIHSCLEALADICPRLRHIRIEGEINSTILDDILRFKSLKVFDSGFDVETINCVQQYIPLRIHVEMLDKLTSLNNLTTLLLSFHHLSPQSFSLAPSLKFTTLTRVAIKANQVGLIATVLTAMPNLEHLVVVTLDFTIADCEELGRQLSLCPGVRHLEIYSFRVMATVIPASYIDPFKFLPLETLVLDSLLGHDVIVPNSLIHKIGSTWPKLRTLRLFPTAHATYVTPSSLINSVLALGRLCPSLKDLALCTTHIRQQSRIISFAGHETSFRIPDFY